MACGDDGVIFTGDVRGSIHLFKAFQLVKSAKAHSDCVTFIEWSENQLFVLSKSANIKVFSEELELIEILKMPQMSICSQISNSKHLVLGFSGHDSILYDV